MKKASFLILLFLVVFFLEGIFNNAQAQSGWVRDKKSAYLQLSYSYFASDNFYNLSGNKLTTNTFSQHSIHFYGEYGLLDRLTIIASVPLFRANQFKNTDSAIGVGDLMLQLKYALLKGKFPLAIIIAPEFPTAKADNFATNKESIFVDRINLPTGDGEFNLWTMLAVSHSFGDVPLYISAHAGYNFRTKYQEEEFNDQVRYGLELGYTIAQKLTLNTHLNGFATVGNQPLTGDFIRSNGTSYNSYSIGAFYKLTEKLRLTGQVQGYFDGLNERKNLYSAPVFTLGLAWEKK
jgi:hypothetical protein